MAIRARKIILFLVVLMMAAFSPALSGAQDDDLLKEIEGKPEEKSGKGSATPPGTDKLSQEKEESLLGQLKKNFHGSLRLRGTQYWQNAPERDGADTRNSFGEALLKFSNKVKYNKMDFNIGGWTEFGPQENTYAGTAFSDGIMDTERRRHILEFNEIYANYNGLNFNALVGRKTVTNGLSTLYSPSDRMRPMDMNDPLDPKDLNRWQGRLDYFIDATTLSAVFLPVYQGNKAPSNSSRWVGNARQPMQSDLYDAGTTNLEEDRVKLTDTNFGYFVRGKTTKNGWDFFASYYHGPNPYFVIREEQRANSSGITETVKIKEVVKVDTWAAGFSTTHEKWEFHGEAVYNYSYDGKDDNYYNYVLGTTYTIDEWAKKIGFEKIDVTAEYANEIITNYQDSKTYTSSSKKQRLGRNDIFSRINLEYNNKLSFQFQCNFNITYGAEGRYQKLQARYKLRDGLVSRLAVEFFGGQDESLYGRWSKNDRAILELEYSF